MDYPIQSDDQKQRHCALPMAIRWLIGGIRIARVGLADFTQQGQGRALRAWCAAALLPISLAAAGPGDEVVVVYNTRVPESKAVADSYAARRGVPTNQVLGFALKTTEEISRSEFRDDLQKPLLKVLDQRKLLSIRPHTHPSTNHQPRRVEWRVTHSSIRYLVLCYGVPVKIAADPNLIEPGAQELRLELRRNEAAVDSELACLPMVEQGYLLSGPLANRFYTVTNAALLHPTNGLLMVARLDGPGADIAQGLVDKALAAETNGLWGRAYFDWRGLTNTNAKIGDDWIRGAAEISRHFGFETVVDDSPGTFPPGFPMDHIALYAGWYNEHVSGPFTLPRVEFMPGAFAYHIHSYSAGILRNASRHWVGPLLAKGATATMGSVNEPYLIGTPDIAVFLGRLLAYGFTFGEAAYAAQSVLSWQTTVIGDPLYRPFGKSPPQLHRELEQRQSRLVEWSHLRVANLNLVRGFPLAEVVTYLEQIPTTPHSAVLTEKLGDLYAAQGKPSSAVHTWQKALRLNPSPQQKVRLLRTVADKLLTLNRPEDAFAAYQQFLNEFPDHPDVVAIYRKVVPLARQLNKPEAERYAAELQKLTAPAKP